MDSPLIEGILLAAGESRRMGFPKPMLRVEDETFLQRSARMMLECVSRLVIVLGAHAEKIRPAVPIDSRVVTVLNSDFHLGQLSSLQAGLKEISSRASAAIIQLADHPMVLRSTYGAVADLYRHSRAPIVIARYRGKRGHPVIFDRSMFAQLAAAPAEQGARFVVNANSARVVYSDVDDSGVVLDLDTPEDLARAGLPPPPIAGKAG